MKLPTFARRLRALREATGLTQHAFALQSGIAQQNINKWERGLALPTWQNVQRLAKALGVDATAFA